MLMQKIQSINILNSKWNNLVARQTQFSINNGEGRRLKSNYHNQLLNSLEVLQLSNQHRPNTLPKTNIFYMLMQKIQSIKYIAFKMEQPGSSSGSILYKQWRRPQVQILLSQPTSKLFRSSLVIQSTHTQYPTKN